MEKEKEKTKYRFNYVEIRKANLDEWFVKYFYSKFNKACKFNASHNRGIAAKFVEAKGWEPSEADKTFALSQYGKLEDWNISREKKIEFIRLYKQFNETISEEEYNKQAEKTVDWFTENICMNDLFKWDDKLNYSGLEHQNYEIFVDLYFRDENGKPTLRYNVLDDEVTYDGVPFTREHLYGVFLDYAQELFKVKRDIVKDVYDMNIRWEHRNLYLYDVLKAYLNRLMGSWDGVERAETWLIKYLKAPDCNYIRHATFNWLFNAVRSVYEPTKYPFLHMLVLKGETDCGKTATMEHLFKIDGKDRFTYNIKMTDDQSKVAAILRTCWALGFGERCGISKDDNNVQKQFMDTLNAEIRYQKKFQNEVTTYKPHNCVYVSTNDDKLLNDYTVIYNKRYWIIPCNITAKEYQENGYWNETLELQDQLWAEMVYKYHQEPDRKLTLDENDINELIEIQSNFMTIDKNDINFMLDSLINKKFRYDIGEKSGIMTLKSEEDFISQFKSNDNGPSARTLNVFPVAYIKKWKELKGLDSRSDGMIKKHFEELGWVYCQVKYNGSNIKCWKDTRPSCKTNLFGDELI